MPALDTTARINQLTTRQHPLSKGKGAYFAEDSAAQAVISKWLDENGIKATAFSLPESESFIRLVEDQDVSWIVLASACRALTLPWFDRLFRVLVETDTVLWSALDDTEFGVHLFLSMIDNWEFLAPYVPEATESTSLASVRDALSRIEARIRTNAADADVNGLVEKGFDLAETDEHQIVKNGLVIKSA